MKILHVVPRGCLFESSIRRSAEEFGHDLLTYSTVTRFGIIHPKDLMLLFSEFKRRPNELVVFHFVPHFIILLISFLLHRFKYGLQYWGEDYYSTFLDLEYFERHCLAKSSLLEESFYKFSPAIKRPKIIKLLVRYVGLLVLKRATVILSLSPKQFRILKMLYIKTFSEPIAIPQITVRSYGYKDFPKKHQYSSRLNVEYLNVLICHSATGSVHHQQTVAILKRYWKEWGVQIRVFGFLSYSGGGEESRKRLGCELRKDLDFAQSICFEYSFLTASEVSERLEKFDIAVFSCLRDEGVGLLTQFVKMGGVVCFNRFSMNFDFFKFSSKNKLLSHEEFLDTSPQKIVDIRKQVTLPFPPAAEFDELV